MNNCILVVQHRTINTGSHLTLSGELRIGRSSGGAAPTTSGTSGRIPRANCCFGEHRDVMNYLVGPAAHVAPPPLLRVRSHISRERANGQSRAESQRRETPKEGSGKVKKKSWKIKKMKAQSQRMVNIMSTIERLTAPYAPIRTATAKIRRC